MKRLVYLLFCALVFSPSAWAVTAFKAKDIAGKELNNEAKNKLVEVYGPRAPHGILPVEWRLVFYDPYAKQDGRMVRVAGDKVVEIDEGYTQLDRFRLAAYKPEEIIDPAHLKIDSNEVMGVLKRSTPLRDVKISSLEMRLRKESKGPIPPVWNVRIYAVNANEKETEIGMARIASNTGQILELKINTDRLK